MSDTPVPEATLFVVADEMLVEVVGRINPSDRDIMLPPLTDLPGPIQATPMWTVVEQYVHDNACVPEVLGGGGGELSAGDGLREQLAGAGAHVRIVGVAAAARQAALAVCDGHGPVRARYGVVSVEHYLLRLAVNRSLVAHYIAAYLGSTACPLPEELARPLHELTTPDADRWRALGIFGEPMPVPHLASRRDTFLLTAGHLPHPLGH